jgi:hypothetical protein
MVSNDAVGQKLSAARDAAQPEASASAPEPGRQPTSATIGILIQVVRGAIHRRHHAVLVGYSPPSHGSAPIF